MPKVYTMIIFISPNKHWQTQKKQKEQQYRVKLAKLSCWANSYRNSNIRQEKNLKNLKSR